MPAECNFFARVLRKFFWNQSIQDFSRLFDLQFFQWVAAAPRMTL